MVMIHWFKWEGGNAMPNNRYCLLLCYCKTCTHIVVEVTYLEGDYEAITGVAVAVPAVMVTITVTVTADAAVAVAVDVGVAVAVAVDVGVPTAAVGGTGVLWSIITAAQPLATAARPSPNAATRTAAAAQPPPAATRTAAPTRSPPAATRTDDADRTPTAASRTAASTKGKPTSDAAAAGIPDAAHPSTQDQSTISVAALPAIATTTQDQSTISVAALPALAATAKRATAAFSNHNIQDDD
jgi:hypothetical protein